MGTFIGFGTLYFGWKDIDENLSEANLWFVAFNMPVYPIKKDKIKFLSGHLTSRGYFSQPAEIEDFYEVIESDIPDWDIARKTYFKAYLLFPLLGLAPIVALVWIMVARALAKTFTNWDFIELALSLIWLIVVILLVDSVLTKARARHRIKLPKSKYIQYHHKTIGTRFYNFKAIDKNTAEVTVWIIVLFIPVIPIGRCRIEVLDGAYNEKYHSFRPTDYRVVSPLSIDWNIVLRTYIRLFIVLFKSFLIFTLPGALFFAIVWLVGKLFAADLMNNNMLTGFVTLISLWGFYIFYRTINFIEKM